MFPGIGTESDRQGDLVRGHQMSVSRLLEKAFPELRVGDVDEGEGALTDGLPVEMGDSELGDDVVDVRPGGDHAGSTHQSSADP